MNFSAMQKAPMQKDEKIQNIVPSTKKSWTVGQGMP